MTTTMFAIGRKSIFPDSIVWVAVVAACLASVAARADNKYRAFYYDAEYRLLQVEDVPDALAAKRNLVGLDDSVMTIPMLTTKDTPLIKGDNIPMSRFAVIAVDYAYQSGAQAGNSDVQALPEKVEYLGFVGERMLGTCLGRLSTDPCVLPARCHCTGKSCCCY